MIKYLLKFIKDEHLDYFLSEGLYMNAAGYFAVKGYSGESNMWDCMECLSTFPYNEVPSKEKPAFERYKEAKTEFDRLCATGNIFYNIYSGRNRPIWCCSAIENEEIIDGSFKFDKRVISDFFYDADLRKAWAVLIDYESFIRLIKKYPDKYKMEYGKIVYHNPRRTLGTSQNAIFLKRDDISYQREFRLVIYRRCRTYEKKAIIEGIKTRILSVKNPYKAYKYKLPNINSIIVKKFRVEDLEQDKNSVYFDLGKDC